jgi:DNA polymerase-4
MEKYAAVAREVRTLMESVTPLVEPLSIDEAFLDLGGTERLHKMTPAETLARLQKRIETEIGISVSVGLSHNKFLAKIASDRDKPRGFSVIGAGETLDFLAKLPVTAIWGVGTAGAAALKRDGITTVGHLQKTEERTLMARYGKLGLHLARLARGEDARAVTPVRAAKSISSETTFSEDLGDFTALDRHLWRLSEKTAARLKEKELAGRTVVLKLKTAEFRSLTRSRSLGHATQLAEEIYRTGTSLLRPEADGTPYRLIGIGVSALERYAGDQADWLDPELAKRTGTERAIDAVRKKFGAAAIGKGRGLR